MEKVQSLTYSSGNINIYEARFVAFPCHGY